jgi:cyclase
MTRPGADELCFLDITASHEGRDTIYDVVRRTAEACFMPLTVGGGVRTVEDIRKLLIAGADKVSINTAAVKNPGLHPPRRRKNSARSALSSPSTPNRSTRQGSRSVSRFSPMADARTGIDAVDFARKAVELGAGELLSPRWTATAPSLGYNIAADARHRRCRARAGDRLRRRRHARSHGGGVRDGHATAVLAASIFHFGTHTIRETKAHMAANGIPMRLDA